MQFSMQNAETAYRIKFLKFQFIQTCKCLMEWISEQPMNIVFKFNDVWILVCWANVYIFDVCSKWV